ncbi:hypothetical protein [Polaribacter uvawellassae]|uniref:hypothetical protein n=1 Tax=Polaribacter uvawellassae TaxID=3133495 RepID=UPI00321A0B6D
MRNKKQNYLLFSILLFVSSVYSQLQGKADFSFGTLITNQDTIKCFIEKGVNYNSTNIRYKNEKEDKKILKIKSQNVNYLILRATKYDRIQLDNKSLLLEVYKKGNISLYIDNSELSTKPTRKVKFMNDIRVYEKSYSPKYPETYFYIVGKEKTFKIKKRKYKKELKSMMSDNIEILNKIDKLEYKSPLFKFKLGEVISKYNYWFKYDKK